MNLKSLNLLSVNFSYLSINLLAIPCYFLLSISPTIATTLGFETGDFTDWLPSGNTTIQGIFGVTPSEGNFQVLLETGSGSTDVFLPFDLSLESGDPPLATGFLFNSNQISAYGTTQGLFYTQGSAIKIENPINLPKGKQLTLLFDYNFLTNEDPSTGNEDLVFISVNEDLIPLTSVKTANLNTSSNIPSFAFSTGYQFNQFYNFTSTGSYTLGFGILDADDFATSSGLLLDNIRIEIVDIPASIPEPVFSPWLSLGIAILLTSNALPKQR